MKVFAFLVVLLAVVFQLNAAPVDQTVFLQKMREFATQSFDEYKIDMIMRTVDKEFDYRKITGASKDSTSHLVSAATEYKQGDRYTIKLQIPLDDVDTQTHYWTGTEAFVANQSGIHTTCQKVQSSQIFISLSTVFSELDKPEFYDFKKVKDVGSEKLVHWNHPGLLASGWIKMNVITSNHSENQFPLYELVVRDPEGDYRFTKISFQTCHNLSQNIFELPSQCRR